MAHEKEALLKRQPEIGLDFLFFSSFIFMFLHFRVVFFVILQNFEIKSGIQIVSERYSSKIYNGKIMIINRINHE